VIPISSLPRKIRNRVVKFATYFPRQQKLNRTVAKTKPMPVDATGPAQVHMLCGHSRLADGIATLKSFYRFAPIRYPLVFHDDGTLTAGDGQTLSQHFPGVRVIWRRDSDPHVNGLLAQRGLKNCVALRAKQPHQLKLFDFVVYASGKPFIQLDSDILFLKAPTEVFDSLARPGSGWKDRYNVDFTESYTFGIEQVKRETGIDLLPNVNVGLMCLLRDESSFEQFEKWITMPVMPDRSEYFLEQSLSAIESSRRGAAPLGPEYDVGGELQSKGGDVVSEHYCSTYRPYFYDHFCDRVAPTL
jgi:hypothetical protein